MGKSVKYFKEIQKVYFFDNNVCFIRFQYSFKTNIMNLKLQVDLVPNIAIHMKYIFTQLNELNILDITQFRQKIVEIGRWFTPAFINYTKIIVILAY